MLAILNFHHFDEQIILNLPPFMDTLYNFDFTMSKKIYNILAADDDLEDLELMEDAILSLEPETKIHTVTNGNGVIDFLNNAGDDQLPHLIVLDYNMPELNGAEVLAQICNEDRLKEIPKIILSTSGAPLHINECMNSGATEYFVKPNNLADLETLARKMLDFCKR